MNFLCLLLACLPFHVACSVGHASPSKHPRVARVAIRDTLKQHVIKTMDVVVRTKVGLLNGRFDSEQVEGAAWLGAMKQAYVALGFVKHARDLVTSHQPHLFHEAPWTPTVPFWTLVGRGTEPTRICGMRVAVPHGGYISAEPFHLDVLKGVGTTPVEMQDEFRRNVQYILSRKPVDFRVILKRLYKYRAYVNEALRLENAFLAKHYPLPAWNPAPRTPCSGATKRVTLRLPPGALHPLHFKRALWRFPDLMRLLVLALPSYLGQQHQGKSMREALLQLFPSSTIRSAGEPIGGAPAVVAVARSLVAVPFQYQREARPMYLVSGATPAVDAVATGILSGQPLELLPAYRSVPASTCCLLAEKSPSELIHMFFGFTFGPPEKVFDDADYRAHIALNVDIPAASQLGDEFEALLALRQMQIDPAALYEQLTQ